MNSSFYVTTTTLGLALWLAGRLVPAFQGVSNSEIWILTIIVFGILTMLFKKWVEGTKNKSAIRFTTAVNGVTAVKMLLTLSIITIYLATEQSNPTEYVFGVFIVFICYTALFVFDAQREIRKGQKNS